MIQINKGEKKQCKFDVFQMLRSALLTNPKKKKQTCLVCVCVFMLFLLLIVLILLSKLIKNKLDQFKALERL